MEVVRVETTDNGGEMKVVERYKKERRKEMEKVEKKQERGGGKD